MKTLRIISIILFIGSQAIGQDVKIPTDYQLNTVEDYSPYKDSVIIAANWIIDNPLNQSIVTRQLANKFLFRWVSGAPYTHIEIRPEFTNDIMNDKNNPYSMDLLMNYIAGMILVKIEDNDSDDLIAQEAGIVAMLRGYESIKNDYKIKFLERLLKIEKKNELSQWIRENAKTYDPKDKTKIIPKD